MTVKKILKWYCSRGLCGQCENNNWKKCDSYNQLSAMLNDLVNSAYDYQKEEIDQPTGTMNKFFKIKTLSDWKKQILNQE